MPYSNGGSRLLGKNWKSNGSIESVIHRSISGNKPLPETSKKTVAQERTHMNAELVKKALTKVPNPAVLVNMISRRVRQLSAGGGGTGRPLIADVGTLGLADIALREIIEDKMGFEMPELVVLTRPSAKNRKKNSIWAKKILPENKQAN